jgi:FtsP/CotA-like multicopper oxidase with cupredoxin domain
MHTRYICTLSIVDFEIVSDFKFTYSINGTQPIIQSVGVGEAMKVSDISSFTLIPRNSSIYYDSAPKNLVTVLPGDPGIFEGRGTIIRFQFTKKGKFVWHCHLLSHEDHDMMHPMQVL